MESRALKCFTMVLEQIIRQLVVLKDDKELGLAEGLLGLEANSKGEGGAASSGSLLEGSLQAFG